MVGVPMCGGVDHCTVTYAEVLAGDRDADAAYFAEQLVANGQPNAYVRMGWEGNQSSTMGTPTQYAAAVQRLVPIMKGAAPDLQFIWNPTMNSGELTNVRPFGQSHGQIPQSSNHSSETVEQIGTQSTPQMRKPWIGKELPS